MIDRTADFLSALKDVKKRDGIPGSLLLATRSKKPKTSFGVKCKDLVESITQLRDFLLKNRKAYIGGVGQHNELTDLERDKVDVDSQAIIKSCSNALLDLRTSEVKDPGSPNQLDIHKKYTIDLIQKYLRSVCRIYTEQKAIRVKQVVDKRLMSRLQSNGTRKTTPVEQEEQTKFTPKAPVHLYNPDDELSSDEEAIYEQENVQLLSDMNSMMDEVNAIENQVVEIVKLQEMFTEQVLQQSEQIDVISETVVESSENVKDGNEELREAIKNNAGFRVWILFFLVMCSFSLLFLEWYS
uniref:Syntaxin-18 n=1 Tax=Phallusia mammillata TaxID=59560 RepID=A0A6F9DTB1_9ASCI|nr:syntaxin-18 [Phallusia mammillata]